MVYRYLLKVSYDGTNYNGFQKQTTSKNTIEEKLTIALNKVTKEEVKIYASGRTDSKVHALNQVVHFDCGVLIDCENFKKAINSLLPQDIHINKCIQVNSDFHARFTPHKKTYKYIVSLNEQNPFEVNYKWFYPYTLSDFEKIDDAINMFLGTHNFKAFAKEKKEEVPLDYYIRTIDSFTYNFENNELTFIVTSKGFMHKQIRTMVAMILEVLRGKITLENLKSYIDSDTKKCNKVANGCGLYLVSVDYEN